MSEDAIDRTDEGVTFRYKRRLSRPIDTVWNVITDPAENEVWYGGRVEIEPRVGGGYISNHRGGMRVVDRVTRYEPPRLLQHTFWVELNPDALVTWELEPAEEASILLLTHALSMDDIRNAIATVRPGDDVESVISSTFAGWQRLLGKLEEAL